YIPNTHSFGMSWFDQFDSGWLPWAGQTAENSWYFGGTRSALGYYHNQYLKGLQKEESFAQENQKTTYSTFPGVLLASFFSNSADIYELGKLLLEGGLIYGQVSIIQLAKDMIALIHGLLIEGVGNYSVLNKGLQAWIEIKSLACEGTPFKIDEKTRNNIQDSTDEIYRISQQEGLTFKQLWDAYGVPWGGSRYGVMPIGFLEWYKKRFV
ncbi:MAG: hypothetical protein LDL38_12950, partial [Flavobacterium piscis]|nr:hypothetical protein [Flavobacterium piscis]